MRPECATPVGVDYARGKLAWMRAEKIWPNGQRYLWTDDFGVVLLTSLYAELGQPRYLDEAEWLVAEVDRGARATHSGPAGDPSCPLPSVLPQLDL